MKRISERSRPLWTAAVMILVATASSTALVVNAPVALAAHTPPPKPDPGPAVASVSPVPTRFATAPHAAAAPCAATATAFPAAATATIELTAEPGATRHPNRARAAGAPVWAQPIGDAHGHYGGPARARVTVLDHAMTMAAGVSGVLVTVAGVGSGAGAVRIGVDYSGFAQAYGGNFGSRLRLVQLPDCVLTTPTVAACRQAMPLHATNDPAAKSLSVQVTLSAEPAGAASPSATSAAAAPMVLAAVSDSGQDGGAGGSYAATTLSPSGSWTAGGNTGAFSYT